MNMTQDFKRHMMFLVVCTGLCVAIYGLFGDYLIGKIIAALFGGMAVLKAKSRQNEQKQKAIQEVQKNNEAAHILQINSKNKEAENFIEFANSDEAKRLYGETADLFPKTIKEYNKYMDFMKEKGGNK